MYDKNRIEIDIVGYDLDIDKLKKSISIFNIINNDTTEEYYYASNISAIKKILLVYDKEKDKSIELFREIIVVMLNDIIYATNREGIQTLLYILKSCVKKIGDESYIKITLPYKDKTDIVYFYFCLDGEYDSKEIYIDFIEINSEGVSIKTLNKKTLSSYRCEL